MARLINLGLIIAFSICTMQWGTDHTATIAGIEYELLFKSKDLLTSLTHPLILSGIIGQLCLLYSAISAKPNKWINISGIVLLGAVVLLVLLAGAMSVNILMITSCLPYLILATIFFVRWRKG